MLRERRRHANFKPNRKLDRKSSRGMIYENEELRLRTININAEVERGQSDIKKLRRENYQLRKEIWTLRDEYDRLGKSLRNKPRSVDNFANVSHTCANSADDCKHGCECIDCCSYYLDEELCDMCNENEHCDKTFEECALAKIANDNLGHSTAAGYGSIASNRANQATMPKSIRNEKINLNFDHLSVVSEECTSNSDDQTKQEENGNTNKGPGDEADSGNLDSVYANFQSTIPPLKHFENLSYKDIGPNIDSMGAVQFNSETYQTERTPLQKLSSENNNSMPLPPPPPLSIPETEEGIVQTDKVNVGDKPASKHFFAPLKSKRKGSGNLVDSRGELRPDVFVNNIVPADGNRLATIRKPHNPLKYPSNSNAASIDPESTSTDIQGLSKGIESMNMQKNRIYENCKSAKTPDIDQAHPYRTEMSLVLSYSGNKSKYYTTHNADKESDIETTPPNLPQAMKLFPPNLTYTGKSEIFNQSPAKMDQTTANTENSANEEILSKSSNICPPLENTDGSTTNINLTTNSNGDANLKPNLKDSNDVKDSTQDTSKDAKPRRVSIHFNGIPEEHETEPHSNDSDINDTTNLDVDEVIAITPLSCRRSRRSSSGRKLSDESIGAFLYPPNPFGFGMQKRGRRPSFLSRRHSDSLLPPHHNQYHIDYAPASKSSNRNHCLSKHTHNNHQTNPDGCTNAGLHNMMNVGESTGTSICNSLGTSRESLASQRSTRRKLSVTSHSKSGGKIPWCACWGNGCI